MSPLALAVCFVLSAAFGLAGTWFVRAVARKIGFVNHPNPIVPQHTTAVAYLGGVGAAIGLWVGLSVTAVLAWLAIIPDVGWFLPQFAPVVRWGVAAVGLLFLLLGVVDDKYALAAKWKFGGQLVLAALAVVLGVRCRFTGLPGVDEVLSGFWILVVVNAFNLTDVCDGLVTGISLILFLALAALMGGETLCVAAAGACLGVLRFNAPRASIFLGDAGSHFLGFLVAAVSLLGSAGRGFWPYAAQVFLVTGIVLFELTLLVLVRARKGLAWWKGSPDHFSLRLQAAGLSRWQTDLVAWSITVLLCVGAFALDAAPLWGQFLILAVAVLGLLTFGLLVLRWEVKPSPKLLSPSA
jgi:UDP-GlcNAc:undecaprenyl-phosphate GlcNAc-1-phosphate transferase